jgi:transposase
MNTYSTNLTDSQWSTILVFLDDKRKRKHSLRDIFDAIFYMLKTGCQWCMLPKDFPKWELVYYFTSCFITLCFSNVKLTVTELF